MAAQPGPPEDPTTPRLHELLTREELADLLTPRQREVLKGIDRWYGLRNLAVLLICGFFLFRVMVQPHEALGNFQYVDANDINGLRVRALYVAALVALYYYSYLHDWHFDRIVTIVFAGAMTGFVIDVSDLYRYMRPDAQAVAWIGLALRLLGLWLLYLNMVRSARRPPMPRGLFGPWPLRPGSTGRDL